jgi:hypothetical protein
MKITVFLLPAILAISLPALLIFLISVREMLYSSWQGFVVGAKLMVGVLQILGMKKINKYTFSFFLSFFLVPYCP